MKERCINFDWIEVYCLEVGDEHTPEWFEEHDFKGRVKRREYGTPQYRQMFTLYNSHFPLIEIRRDPYSIKSAGGIFDPRACHLRLSNRSCYLPDPIQFLINFMKKYGFKYQTTTRIDICLDFNHFDNGDNPANFIRDYFANVYTKVHQPRFAAHGKDDKATKDWNSVKWGSPTSSITTKLYNKSLELKEVGEKPYIRQRWEECGLNTFSDVWRCEFSMKSEYKSMVRLDLNEESIARTAVDEETGLMFNVLDINIMTFASREFLRFTFFAIADYYMDFRYIEYTRNGFPKRKYDCKRKVLFRTTADERSFTPTQLKDKPVGDRTDYLLIKKLKAIVNDGDNYTYTERLHAAGVIDALAYRIACKHLGDTIDAFKLNFQR